MVKAHNYTGVLGKPRKSVFPPLEDESYNPFDKECQAAVLARMAAQESALIDALFKDCGVDQKDSAGWMKVTLVLARRHVKAFQETKKVGRKRSSLATDEGLMAEMQMLRSSDRTISNAAKIIAKRRGNPKMKEAIETHYHRIVKDWTNSKELVERWARQTKWKRNSVAKSRS